MDVITSAANPKIKRVVALRQRRQRDKTGLSLAEGAREVQQLIKSRLIIKEIYYLKDKQKDLEPLLLECKVNNVFICEVPKLLFEKISYGDGNQEILAVFVPEYLTLNDLKNKNNAVYLVVESVEKPGNLGAILRTCDGAGIDGLIICDGKTDLYNPNVIRASIGTVFTQNIVITTNPEAVEFLKNRNVIIYATSPAAQKLYTAVDCKKSCAFIVGSESAGLTDFWMSQADQTVKIPMSGEADSLNVSTSTALFLYEAIRQRQ